MHPAEIKMNTGQGAASKDSSCHADEYPEIQSDRNKTGMQPHGLLQLFAILTRQIINTGKAITAEISW